MIGTAALHRRRRHHARGDRDAVHARCSSSARSSPASGFGAGFQGAIRTVIPLAAPHERAGVLSIMYVVSYLAMGLPAVIAGFLVVHAGGVLTTAREYGVAVMVLAAVALVGVIRPRKAAQRAAAEVHSAPAPSEPRETALAASSS